MAKEKGKKQENTHTELLSLSLMLCGHTEYLRAFLQNSHCCMLSDIGSHKSLLCIFCFWRKASYPTFSLFTKIFITAVVLYALLLFLPCCSSSSHRKCQYSNKIYSIAQSFSRLCNNIFLFCFLVLMSRRRMMMVAMLWYF